MFLSSWLRLFLVFSYFPLTSLLPCLVQSLLLVHLSSLLREARYCFSNLQVRFNEFAPPHFQSLFGIVFLFLRLSNPFDLFAACPRIFFYVNVCCLVRAVGWPLRVKLSNLFGAMAPVSTDLFSAFSNYYASISLLSFEPFAASLKLSSFLQRARLCFSTVLVLVFDLVHVYWLGLVIPQWRQAQTSVENPTVPPTASKPKKRHAKKLAQINKTPTVNR